MGAYKHVFLFARVIIGNAVLNTLLRFIDDKRCVVVVENKNTSMGLKLMKRLGFLFLACPLFVCCPKDERKRGIF